MLLTRELRYFFSSMTRRLGRVNTSWSMESTAASTTASHAQPNRTPKNTSLARGSSTGRERLTYPSRVMGASSDISAPGRLAMAPMWARSCKAASSCCREGGSTASERSWVTDGIPTLMPICLAWSTSLESGAVAMAARSYSGNTAS